jgi:Peptidase family M23
MRRFGTMIVLSMLLVGCSSSSPPSAPPPDVAASGDSPFDAPPPGITVQDAYTPVLMQVNNPPTVPVAGTDGRFHVAYNLLLQNASPVAATIRKLDVVEATNTGKVLATFSNKQLVDPACKFGDCNRLRALPATPVTDTVIPPQQARVLFVDYSFGSLGEAPKYVMHHLYLDGAVSPVTTTPGPVNYTVTPYSISASGPVIIGPPLKGNNWVALNGCCEPGWPHRSSPVAMDGNLVGGQLFAIDWKQTNNQGAFYTGDKTKNESYVDYGSAVLAVADGTVTGILDEQDANVPGVLPANDPVLGPKLTMENVEGNHIVLDIGNGTYAFYAHLLKGSLRVKPGDKVTKGEVIAKLGNTGNANASHLHLQIMNGPSAIASPSIPYVIDSFAYQDQIFPQRIYEADNYLTGNFFGPHPYRTPETRTNQLPMAWTIINFPG